MIGGIDEQVWMDESGEEHIVNIYKTEFNFVDFTLPILPGFNEEFSEQSLIQLLYMYEKLRDFIKMRWTADTRTCMTIPHILVEKLNFVCDLFFDYLKQIGVAKYIIYDDGIALDPTDCTPRCQRYLESLEEKISELKQVLKDGCGLTLVKASEFE